MSAITDYSALDLREMGHEEARDTLTVGEFERWQKIQDLTDAADDQRQAFRENAERATDILVNATPERMAAELTLWGNDCKVYYDPEDTRVQSAAEDLADALGIDPEAAAEEDPSQVLDTADVDSVDDIEDRDLLGDIKDALVQLIDACLVEWNGSRWADIPQSDREFVLSEIRKPRPKGWGAAGLVDAWVEIQYHVESNRNERMEQVRKFRDPKRRGNRRDSAPDGV